MNICFLTLPCHFKAININCLKSQNLIVLAGKEIFCYHMIILDFSLLNYLTTVPIFSFIYIYIKPTRVVLISVLHADIGINYVDIILLCVRHLRSLYLGILQTLYFIADHQRIWFINVLAHLSWKLKWAFLIAVCPSSVYLLHFYIFNFFSRTTGPIVSNISKTVQTFDIPTPKPYIFLLLVSGNIWWY
jgi:hypothetical protein